jgi:hypothetical protein
MLSHRQTPSVQSYVRGLMTIQNIDSKWLYVVSLNSGTPEGWKISWIDIVQHKRRYFHSVGRKGWPKVPPKYIAFRYYGRLHSIHRVEGYEIFNDPLAKFAEIPSGEWGPNFLYTLGRPFAPSNEVRTGNIFRNGWVWRMLDTLFTCKTISLVRNLSKQRDRKE